MAVPSLLGRTTGPLFVNADSMQSTTGEMNALFSEVLSELFEVRSDLFKVDVKPVADLQEKYNFFRSFR